MRLPDWESYWKVGVGLSSHTGYITIHLGLRDLASANLHPNITC